MEILLASGVPPMSLQDIGTLDDNVYYDDSIEPSSAISIKDSDTLDGGMHDYGKFVDSDDDYEVDGYAEQMNWYTSGRLYPICIGDVLADTYRIEHKLHHGTNSVVWLARDIEKQKDVALKIMVPGNEGENEYNMQKEIINTMQDTSNLVTYLDTFFLRGCKGDHRVLVFDVRGPSFYTTLWPKYAVRLFRSHSPFENFSMATRMSAARQLLQALERLHNAGIVHNGELTPACCSLNSVHANYSADLNRENIMWGVVPLDHLDTKTKYEYLDRPLKIALPSDLWRQGELVKPANFPLRLLTDQVYIGDFGLAAKAGLTDQVYIGDFGLASKAGTDVSHNKIPSFLHLNSYAPEIFHDMKPSFASDMWSYMSLFSELYLGFVPWGSAQYSLMVDKMVKVLGPLPRDWKGRCSHITTLADNSWYDQRRKPVREKTLESILKTELPELSSVERKHVLKIMSQVFCYIPNKRPSATQLLRDPSFQAIMEIHCR
jgi:serine/threonine protein kinase